MGGYMSVVSQMFPPKPKWGVDDIPDLTGKVMIVTGLHFLRNPPDEWLN